MSISVIFAVKNALDLGYCFLESLHSCLSFADEIIISEGHSKDNTLQYLEKFKKKHDSIIPITLFQTDWEERSYVGEVITKVTEEAIKKASCDYILNLQADEIYHEDLGDSIKKIANMSEYNSVCFPFYHFIESWSPYKNPAYREAIRMVRRNRNPRLKGDAWSFFGVDPVYPAQYISKPIYHFAWVFPKTNDTKHISHSNIYQNVVEYQEKMRNACRNIQKEKKPYLLGDFDDFPKLAKRFVGQAEYTIMEEYL